MPVQTINIGLRLLTLEKRFGINEHGEHNPGGPQDPRRLAGNSPSPLSVPSGGQPALGRAPRDTSRRQEHKAQICHCSWGIHGF